MVTAPGGRRSCGVDALVHHRTCEIYIDHYSNIFHTSTNKSSICFTHQARPHSCGHRVHFLQRTATTRASGSGESSFATNSTTANIFSTTYDTASGTQETRNAAPPKWRERAAPAQGRVQHQPTRRGVESSSNPTRKALKGEKHSTLRKRKRAAPAHWTVVVLSPPSKGHLTILLHLTMTMTHSEKSNICQMKAWPYKQECRGHDPTKKNLLCC